MNPIEYLLDFYKKLNTPGLILFWSIIFLFFFLIFSVIALLMKNNELNKALQKTKKGSSNASNEEMKQFEKVIIKDENKKDEAMIVEVQEEKKSPKRNNEILKEPLKVEKEDFVKIKVAKPEPMIVPAPKPVEKTIIEPKKVDNIIKTNTSPQPNKFIRENKFIDEDIVEEIPIEKNIVEPKEDKFGNTLYQKNLLRELGTKNQTSPIAIGKKVDIINLNDIGEEKLKSVDIVNDTEEEYYNNINNGSSTFLEEISKKIEEELEEPNTIDLTDYEKDQEDEAIISYKDLVNTVKKAETREERYKFDTDDDSDFLQELKSFRSNM